MIFPVHVYIIAQVTQNYIELLMQIRHNRLDNSSRLPSCPGKCIEMCILDITLE